MEPTSKVTPAEVLARLTELGHGTLVEKLGIQLLEASPELIVARMPVTGNTQPAGLLHGGASAALAETLGSYAAALHAGPQRNIVGIELNITHHASARDGEVVGTARAIRLGRTLASFQIEVMQGEKLLATSRLTCMILDAKN